MVFPETSCGARGIMPSSYCPFPCAVRSQSACGNRGPPTDLTYEPSTEGFTLAPDDSSSLLFRCLALDLEVGVRDRRIHAFAGVSPGTGQSLIFPVAGDDLAAALAKLDELADGADFLLGHNLIDFDLPHQTGLELSDRASFGCIPLRNDRSQLYISRAALGQTLLSFNLW